MSRQAPDRPAFHGTTLAVRLTVEQRARLEQSAVENSRSLSGQVRFLIDEHLGGPRSRRRGLREWRNAA